MRNFARDWLRRVRRAASVSGRQLCKLPALGLEEYRIRHELAICLKFKNAGRYLKEWIEFHRLVGVEHFYLYNHNSSDEFQEVLAPYIARKLVTLNHVEGPLVFPQADIHCCKHYGQEARWIAFLDDDEFLFPVKGNDLRRILRKYAAHPGLAVHWLRFGASGHDQRPEGLVIENYTHCEREIHPNIKSIVNPRRVLKPKTPHYPIYKERMLSVNERRMKVELSSSIPPTAEVVRINHYHSKSLEDYREKISRGYGDKWGIEHPLSPDYDTTLDQTQDFTIQRFLPALKEAMLRK